MSLPDTQRLPEQLRVPGIPDRTTSVLPFRIPAWPLWVWFIIGVIMVPVSAIPIMGLARYTTTSSQFCITCHGTGETPDRAVRSLVHPDFNTVACVDCHAQSGQVVFEGYRKGFAAEPERVTANCIRCHTKMTTTNDQNDFKFNFLDIRIPHKFHLDTGATCTTCHTNIAHDLNVPRTNRPSMDKCMSCHAQADSCNKCHTTSVPAAPAPVPAPTTLGLTDGRVIYNRVCAACHGQKGDRVHSADLSSQEFLDRQGDGKLLKATVEGHGVMPAFSKEHGGTMTDDEIRAALGYLKTLALDKAASQVDAKALYEKNCIVCHGADGDKVAGVKHSSKEYWYSQGEPVITKAISNGKGGMPPFAKGRGGSLTPVDIEAIVGYLKSFPPPNGTAPAKPSQEGKELYTKNCAGCHGDKGDRVPSANLGSKEYTSSRGETGLAKATAEGKGGMPGFGKAKGGPLTDEQVKQVVEYLQSLAGAN